MSVEYFVARVPAPALRQGGCGLAVRHAADSLGAQHHLLQRKHHGVRDARLLPAVGYTGTSHVYAIRITGGKEVTDSQRG